MRYFFLELVKAIHLAALLLALERGTYVEIVSQSVENNVVVLCTLIFKLKLSKYDYCLNCYRNRIFMCYVGGFY